MIFDSLLILEEKDCVNLKSKKVFLMSSYTWELIIYGDI